MGASFPCIEVVGTHHEVGRQIGEAAADLVARGLAYYESSYPVLAGMTFAAAVDRARPYLAPAQAWAPQLVDQLRGLAEGAGVPFEYLFAVNCTEEFTSDPAGTSVRGEHCTSFAFVHGGRTYAGHNEDWYPGDIETLVLRRVTLAGGLRYIAMCPAAALPMTAMNSRGIVSTATTLYSHEEGVGVPNQFVLAALHESHTLEEARARIEEAPRARASSHLLCDKRGRIWGLETTAGRAAFLDGGRCFAHTNHYLSPELSPDDASDSEGTRTRLARAKELLDEGLASASRGGAKGAAQAVALAQSVLTDHANAPLSICGHWDDDDPDLDQSVTTASMVWDVSERAVHVALGQPCEHEYLTYGL